MTTEYRGSADVARWCGVTRTAVSNWLRRFPGEIPAPDAIIAIEDGGPGIKGWLPERRPEWEAFATARNAKPEQVAARTAGRRNRNAAALIVQGTRDGAIDPAEAVKLLAELI